MSFAQDFQSAVKRGHKGIAWVFFLIKEELAIFKRQQELDC